MAVELARQTESRRGFSPEFKREFVEKIVTMDKTLGDLAEELGIPPEVMQKWTLMVERSETNGWRPDELLVPASRILELEHDLEELRRVVTHQATTIRILEKKDTL